MKKKPFVLINNQSRCKHAVSMLVGISFPLTFFFSVFFIINLAIDPSTSRLVCSVDRWLEVLRSSTRQGAASAAASMTVILTKNVSGVFVPSPHQPPLSSERIIISENYANHHILSLSGFAPPLSKSPRGATGPGGVYSAPCSGPATGNLSADHVNVSRLRSPPK